MRLVLAVLLLLAAPAAARAADDVVVIDPAASPAATKLAQAGVDDACWTGAGELLGADETERVVRTVGPGSRVVRRLPRGTLSTGPGCWTTLERRSSGRSLTMDVQLRRGSGPAQVLARIEEPPDGGWGFAWSADGRRVAFADGGQPTHLHVHDVATGARVARIPVEPYAQLEDHGLSRDGTKIAYVEDVDGDQHVKVADVATGASRAILRASRSPAWSPVEDRLAVGTRTGILTVDANGRAPLRAPGLSGESLAWSPDGTRVAYVTDGENAEYAGVAVAWFGTSMPWVRPVLGRTSSWVSPPAWSPDGTRVAVARSPSDY